MCIKAPQKKRRVGERERDRRRSEGVKKEGEEMITQSRILSGWNVQSWSFNILSYQSRVVTGCVVDFAASSLCVLSTLAGDRMHTLYNVRPPPELGQCPSVIHS
jgi:hypothetical protein